MNELLQWPQLAATGTSVGALALLLGRVRQRLELSLAKHPSLAGHPRTARRLARWLPAYQYTLEQALAVDGAPETVLQQRRAALQALIAYAREHYARTLAAGASAQEQLADLQFTSAYRLPFQFRVLTQQGLKIGSFLQASGGVQVTDLDGNRFYDLTGSYGVNLFGYDFYKDCIAQGADSVAGLGPVLGSYHPLMLDNLQRLRQISGMQQVSLHMSGTEAVMQAVRLARYHTGRARIVRFCGSYHGWWGDVQPGIGNPVPARDTLTLAELSQRTLGVLRRRRDIACVLVNPLQALHPNIAAPSDGALLDSGRRAGFDRAAYSAWLQQLRAVCDERGIALILDEVFLGFRLARGGAQEYFGVRADLVTYGKTLGGGLPIGVLCGDERWMRRFRDDAPGDICFARGTFNAHPYVMGAMNAFLRRLDDADVQTVYAGADALWAQRAQTFNQRLQDAGLPMQVAAMGSVWTVLYTQPACFNWLFQHYLRRAGIALSWVGTGRLIWSLNFSDADFNEVLDRWVQAGHAMQADGWWWGDGSQSNRQIRRRVLKESLLRRIGR